MKYFSRLLLTMSASLVTALGLVACGDENTYVTQGDNKPSVSVLESGKKLYKQPCDSTNIGSQLYVKDSSSMYFCDGEDWISMKGEKGDTGKTGASGKDGDDGSSCTAKKIEKDNRTGYILTCGEDVADTIWNGENGEPGKSTETATSCKATKVEKEGRNGIEFSCGDTVIDTLWNGVDGNLGGKGDSGVAGASCTAAKVSKDGRNGVELSCGGTIIDTLWNGTDGKSYFETNCTITNVAIDGHNGFVLICDGSVVDTLWDEIRETSGVNIGTGINCTMRKIYYNSNSGVEISCDDSEADTLWNCGRKFFDPDTALCKERMLYTCERKGFDPDTAFCMNGKLHNYPCYGLIFDSDTHYCKNATTITAFDSINYDGLDYKTVEIGSQTWMAENLNYSDSVRTPNLKGSTWCGGKNGEVEGDCSKYGRLYTWYAAINHSESECKNQQACHFTEKIQGICPDGWHLPDEADIDTLLKTIGGFDVAGAMLKSTSGWNSYLTLDGYGFSALPAGYIDENNHINHFGISASFWVSGDFYNSYARRLYIDASAASASTNSFETYYGLSVRCLKDSD